MTQPNQVLLCDRAMCPAEAEYLVKVFITEDVLESPTTYYFCAKHMRCEVRKHTETVAYKLTVI